MSSFLSASPRNTVDKHPEVEIPSAQQGEPIPYMFGTYDMTGTCIYPVDPSHAVKRQESTGQPGKGGFGGGYATGSSVWFLNFAILYTCNPIASVFLVKIDDNIIWGTGDPNQAVLSSGAILPWGYATLSNGTLKGNIRFYFGLPDQATDPFFVCTPSNSDLPNQSIPMPSWPGCSWAMFEDFQAGTSPTVPKIKIRAVAAQRAQGVLLKSEGQTPVYPLPVTVDTGYPLTDLHVYVNTGNYFEANPVHVIADMLTNTQYGCGMDVDRLLTRGANQGPVPGSWDDAAATVHCEKLGVSGYIDQQDKVDSLVDDLLDHIGGFLVRRGSQWALRLVRNDYSFSDALPIAENQFSEAPTIKPGLQTGAPSQIWAEYKDQTRDYTDTPVAVPNVALWQANNGIARVDRVQFKYYTAQQPAITAAQTRAPLILSPPDTIQFKLSRYAGISLEVGDVIVPTYSLCQNGALDGTRVFRITKLDKPVGGKYCEVEAYEEFASLLPGTKPVPPFVAPPVVGGIQGVPMPDQFPVELPWDLAGGASMQMQMTHLTDRLQQIYSQFQLLGDGVPNNGSIGGADASDTAIGENFQTLTGDGTFVQGGTLSRDYLRTTLAVDDDGLVFTPGNPADLASYWTTASVLRSNVYLYQRLMLLGDPATGAHEWCAWSTIEPGDGGAYIVKGIVRGLFDTWPQTHPAGRRVFLMQSQAPFAVDLPVSMANNSALYVIAVPFNQADSADPSAMGLQKLLLQQRTLRPFPVTNLRVNGVGAPLGPTYTPGQDAVITWIPRTRGAGIGYNNPNGPFDPQIAVEGDFLVNIYTVSGATLTLLRGPIIVPATQTLMDPVLLPASGTTPAWGPTRVYYRYTDAQLGADGYPSAFVVQVNSRNPADSNYATTGWPSLYAAQATVNKA